MMMMRGDVVDGDGVGDKAGPPPGCRGGCTHALNNNVHHHNVKSECFVLISQS